MTEKEAHELVSQLTLAYKFKMINMFQDEDIENEIFPKGISKLHKEMIKFNAGLSLNLSLLEVTINHFEENSELRGEYDWFVSQIKEIIGE